MDKKYEKSLHVVGRLGLLIGISFMLGIPAIICAIFDVWPSSVGQVLTVGGSLLLVFLPTALAEVVSYTPVLGSSAYITFLTGNVLNLKLPCVINSHSLTGTTQGTDEGDTIASISVAASTITTTGSPGADPDQPGGFHCGRLPAALPVRRHGAELCQ